MTDDVEKGVASKEVQDAIRAMIFKRGAVKTAEDLGIGREAVLRLVGGIPVRAGTLSMVVQKLSSNK